MQIRNYHVSFPGPPQVCVGNFWPTPERLLMASFTSSIYQVHLPSVMIVRERLYWAISPCNSLCISVKGPRMVPITPKHPGDSLNIFDLFYQFYSSNSL